MKQILSLVMMCLVSMGAFAAPQNANTVTFEVSVLTPPAGENLPVIYPPKYISELNSQVRMRNGCEAKSIVKSWEAVQEQEGIIARAEVVVQANCLQSAFILEANLRSKTWSDESPKYSIRLEVPVGGGVTGSN